MNEIKRRKINEIKRRKISFNVKANNEGIKEVLKTLENTNWIIRSVKIDDSKYILDTRKNKLIKVN